MAIISSSTISRQRRVLIPTDDSSFIDAISHAYTLLGYDVYAGLINLAISPGKFDLLHLQWPEELCNWKAPTDDQIESIAMLLELHRQKGTVIIGEAHNLQPHRTNAHSQNSYQKLYDEVYSRCDLIGHCTEFSRDSLIERHSRLLSKPHIVHRPFSYRTHKKLAVNAQKKIKSHTIGVFGAIRDSDEEKLINTAFKLIRNPRKKLLMNARLTSDTRIRGALRKIGLLTRYNTNHLSDAELDQSMQSCDVVLIPRMPPHNNSGLMYLAMELGVAVAAPDYGPYREILAGTPNGLYPPGKPQNCAATLDHLLSADTAFIGNSNRNRAKDWGWTNIIQTYEKTGILFRK
jgi:glycosyltransferase involved in cell wall biosynthesis